MVRVEVPADELPATATLRIDDSDGAECPRLFLGSDEPSVVLHRK